MKKNILKAILFFSLFLSVAFFDLSTLMAYSILSHEAIIDVSWKENIVPILRQRFSKASSEELKIAHAYAYGGSIIQDIGYYPHGNKFLSNLMHYVRSGDFIRALINDSKDLNEYAFALGALSHYSSDNDGHSLGTNLVVPILYPKLQKKFGDVVTYEDDSLAHLQAEFGFDVLEIAKQRFAPDAYHDFIGFEVSQSLFERAFREVYGLDLSSLLKNEEKAINSYRHAISSTIPKATKVAWQLKKDQIQKDIPGITRKKFLYNLSRASYEKNWGDNYEKPTFKEKLIAFFIRILPKIGPLKALKLRLPTPETEEIFEKSFNITLTEYRILLTNLSKKKIILSNENFDLGKMTARGEYHLADETYAELLKQLAELNFSTTSKSLRDNLLNFYSTSKVMSHPIKVEEWKTIQNNLNQLKNFR